jgi:hypothetical protein
MYRNLFVFICLSLSGCILYLDDTAPTSSSSDHASSSDDVYFYTGNVWLESPYISCSYDAYWDISDWTFEIYADSYYGPYEVIEVGFYIDGYDYQYMDYAGDGLWYRTYISTYYDCDRAYRFDFVAMDYDGYEGLYTYYW